MKAKLISTFLTIVYLTIACNNNASQQQEQQQAWDEIMAVHDEVMPKMSDVNRMTSDLRAKTASLDSTQVETKAAIMDAMLSLERADEGMMTWMAEVQAPEMMRGENKTHAEIMRYLGEEKNKVNQVRDSILLSLQRGEQLLQQTTIAIPDTTIQQ